MRLGLNSIYHLFLVNIFVPLFFIFLKFSRHMVKLHPKLNYRFLLDQQQSFRVHHQYYRYCKILSQSINFMEVDIHF